MEDAAAALVRAVGAAAQTVRQQVAAVGATARLANPPLVPEAALETCSAGVGLPHITAAMAVL